LINFTNSKFTKFGANFKTPKLTQILILRSDVLHEKDVHQRLKNGQFSDITKSLSENILTQFLATQLKKFLIFNSNQINLTFN